MFAALLGATTLLVAIFAVVKPLLTMAGPFTWGAGAAGTVSAALLVVGATLTPTLSDPSQFTLLLVLRMLPSATWAMTPRIQELQVQVDPSRLHAPASRLYSRLPYVALAVVFGMLVLSLAALRPGRPW